MYIAFLVLLSFLQGMSIIEGSRERPLVGGFASDRPATPNEQTIMLNVKEQIENSVGKEFTALQVINYKVQVVAGTIYLMKVKADDDSYLHVKIFVPLPYTGNPPSLMAAKDGMTADDLLVPL